jgi:MoaA/NifB/PqqE/SkfB family radical SAM enzyme
MGSCHSCESDDEMGFGMGLRYDVEADWILLTTCNYRCRYCFLPNMDLGAKIRISGTPEQWVEGFRHTGKTWLLHITGGEPFIYPGFVDLCERLAQDHYLSINTNLSHHSVAAFARRIDPGRVHYVHAALHPDEREKRGECDVFIRRVHDLRNHGFHVLVSVVMTPMIVRSFSEMEQYFESQGVFLVPKVLRGKYEGGSYPAAYSEKERASIVEYLATARRKYAQVIDRMGEPPTIDMFSDGRFLNNRSLYWGRVCGSGYNFVRIDPDGMIVRCGSGQRLGNILRKDIRLLSAPLPCDTSYCPYFCEKYTSTQFAGKMADVLYRLRQVRWV